MKRLVGLSFVSLLLPMLLSACFLFPAKEFIASDEDFAGYDKWAVAGKATGPGAQIGPAHAANTADTTRTIYIKNDTAREANGQYPVGTVIVKDFKDKDGKILGISGMTKRGNGFNAAAGDWEWFSIDAATGKIAVGADGKARRGATAGCISCHTQAKDKDYVFTR